MNSPPAPRGGHARLRPAPSLRRERLLTRLAHVETHMTGKDYILGATFTLPDAYLFTVLRWTVPLKIDLAPYPNLQAFQKRMEARPAVRAAMKAEGLIT